MGGFFSISGYVMAYVATNMGERSHNVQKLKKPELFFWQKAPGLNAGGTLQLLASFTPVHLFAR